MSKASEIETTVKDLLEQNGITFTATYRGERKKALNGDHTMDEWLCTVSSKEETREFEFSTGLGLRAEPTAYDQRIAKSKYSGVTDNDITRRTLWGRNYLAMVESLRKPKAPSAASVLHSLIMDSSACEQSFDSWCSDFGYDSDSRKAFRIYEACQRNGDKLNRVIPRAVRVQLGELLQEY